MILKPGKETVLVIPDLQIPFHHPDSFEFLTYVKDKYKPTEIVCIGDEVDMHALSDYDHDPDGYSAGEELTKSLEYLHALYEIFPTCKVVTSNHTARPFRRAHKFGIPRAFLKQYHEFLQAPPGWEWRDSWIIDDVYYFHGEGFSGAMGASKAAMAQMRPVVMGHLHSHAGIHYIANERELIYGFNVGCLIDNKAYAFAYGKHCPTKPILGCGIVREGVPTFIPMLLDDSGKWIRSTRNENKGAIKEPKGPEPIKHLTGLYGMDLLRAKACPECGSHSVQKRGVSVSTSGKTQRYQCNKCSKWFSQKV